MKQRPPFLASYFRAIGDAIGSRDYLAILPIWPIVGGGVGFSVTWYMPASFWAESNLEVAVTVYTGILAFDALLLALGWSAFSKIYEVISTGKFAAFLRRHGLLEDHLLFVDMIHLILVLSALSSGAGLILVLLPVSLLAQKICMAIVIAMSIWALMKSLAATRMMHDLIWELAHSDNSKGNMLKPVPNAEEKG